MTLKIGIESARCRDFLDTRRERDLNNCPKGVDVQVCNVADGLYLHLIEG